MVIVGDEELLAGSAILSAFLQFEGSAVDTEPGTMFDAVVGVGDLNPSGTGRIDKLLSRGVVTCSTVGAGAW